MLRNILSLTTMIALALLLLGCTAQQNGAADAAEAAAITTQVEDDRTTASDSDSGDVTRPAGWSEATHSNDVDPNYEVVFADDTVNTLTITIAPEDWQAMLDNMTELYGEAGTGDAAGGPPQGDAAGGVAGGPPQGFNIEDVLPEGCELPDGFVPGPGVEWPAGCEPDLSNLPLPPQRAGDLPADGAGGIPADLGVSENPDYVPATLTFNGDTWTNVGIRFKGNSTLLSGWASGTVELPLKLDFDEFEDEFPEIDNQRFYGFKQLSLSNNMRDTSYMRTAAAYDVLDAAGLAAPETAWYEIVVDYGDGPISFGIYTVVEVVDDTVVDRSFGSDDGNIYEADGPAASFAAGTSDQLADSFEKENNAAEADYSDLEALYTVLHDDSRLSDSAAWRADLEALFDVDTFLNWLAVNTVITNWDAYGTMWHNYYLYNNPETGQLTWLAWDYNESMQSGGIGGPGTAKSLGLTEVGDEWPLIRFLLDEPVYYERYVSYVAAAADAYDPDALAAKAADWEALLAPYAAAEGNDGFSAAVAELVAYAYERAGVVETFLAAP